MSTFADDDEGHRPCSSVTWVQPAVGEAEDGNYAFKPHYCNGFVGHVGPHGCNCGVAWREPFLPPRRPDWGNEKLSTLMRDLIPR